MIHSSFQRIDYYANNYTPCCDTPAPHNTEKQCVTEKEVKCRISNTTSVEIVRVNLQVPPVPPTDSNSSNIVKVTYFIKVSKLIFFCL